VAFYVPLGPRGGVFRLGTFLIGIMGGMVYRKAYRRRESAFINPTLPRPLLDVPDGD
jgi:hypothetical protein